LLDDVSTELLVCFAFFVLIIFNFILAEVHQQHDPTSRYLGNDKNGNGFVGYVAKELGLPISSVMVKLVEQVQNIFISPSFRPVS